MTRYSPEALQDFNCIVEAFYAHLAGTGYSLPDAKPAGAILTSIKEQVADCTLCEIARSRTNPVFGQGNPLASVMIIGEAPGQQEDAEGLAFVGPAGQLLTQMLLAIKLHREQVFITNIIKCRPPGNRDPLPEETVNCRQYLDTQIALVNPAIICTLGRAATQTMLNSTEPISRLRGRLFTYKNATLLPTYHPSYLLRNPEKKIDAWKDLKLLRKTIDGQGKTPL